MTIGGREYNSRQMEYVENAVKELRDRLVAEGVDPYFIIWGMYAIGVRNTYAYHLKRREDEVDVCDMLQEFVDVARKVHSKVNN